MSITPLNIGSAPNDGNGQNLRSGGQVINDNFSELDARTTAAQAQVEVRLPLAGGAMTGPITSSSTGTFTGLTLTSITGPLINGGETHATVGNGPVLSIARNSNMVNEFIVGSTNPGFAARFNLLKSAGTVQAPTPPSDTHSIGVFQFIPYLSSGGYGVCAAISSSIDGVPGAGVNAPGSIELSTVNSAGSYAVRWKVRSTGNFEPGADNAYSLGSISARATTVYASTGAINTSDARYKTSVSPLTANEIAAAKDLGKEIGTYKWLASIEEKGDGARNHVGMTVQRAIEVMSSHGLDPMAYGFICYDQWESRKVAHHEVVEQIPVENEDGEITYEEIIKEEAREEILPAGDRFSFRYDELNMFIAAGFEARLAILEEKAAN